MKVRNLLLVTAIAACMSPAAWAAQVDKAGGTMRQESPKASQPDTLSPQERRAMEAELGEKPDPSALPHHQLNSHWRWHYRNTTTKPPHRIKPVDSVDKDDPEALPHHQPTTRWSRHHRNTTTKPVQK